MTLNSCEPKNVLETECKAKKHLGTYFATYDFVVPLKKANIKAYKRHRVAKGRALVNLDHIELRISAST